jgi:predicted enzyme related to lactoylglutathione lyase
VSPDEPQALLRMVGLSVVFMLLTLVVFVGYGQVEVRSGSYLTLELGDGLGGGIVECATKRPVWLPYVEVDQIWEQTEHARRLGARVLLEPRQGPAGWRSVVSAPQAGEIAFSQPRR